MYLLISDIFSLILCYRVWISKTKWNIFDCLAIAVFLVAFGMRFSRPLLPYTHAIYATGACYWYVRSLKLISKSLR